MHRSRLHDGTQLSPVGHERLDIEPLGQHRIGLERAAWPVALPAVLDQKLERRSVVGALTGLARGIRSVWKPKRPALLRFRDEAHHVRERHPAITGVDCGRRR
jgi:hypothetical protein